jgi:murein DD-endopeptidase
VKIKWNAVFENERREFERMTPERKFRYFLLLQYHSPYGWGSETPEKSDCSGAVCLALYAATGHLIRTTADDLLKRVFTKEPAIGGEEIKAAFWLDGSGKAVHVCGLPGEGVVLNSEEGGAKVKTLKAVNLWFERRSCRMVIRALDKTALERLSNYGATYGVDKEFWEYFER